MARLDVILLSARCASGATDTLSEGGLKTDYGPIWNSLIYGFTVTEDIPVPHHIL